MSKIDTSMLEVAYKVYSYSCWTYDKEFVEIRIAFLNTEKYRYDGADHSCSSLLRHEFAFSLYELYCQHKLVTWAPLPEHEYLDLLKNNGFQYNEYHACQTNKQTIQIVIRNASELPTIDPINFY